jgi:acetyl esterase/lipase
MKKIAWLTTHILFLNVGYAQQVIPLYPTGQIPNAKAVEVQEIIQTFPSGDKTIRFVVDISTPELTAYLPAKEKANGMAVVICPGGGYSGVAIDHEGHDMAKKLSENGIAGFVLKYRMPKSTIVDNKEFVPLQDAQRALQIVRENAREWGVNPRKVGIAGSSAGGHLASTAGTHYHKTLIDNPKNTNLRPDFMILNYPVISFADSLTHYGSRFNLVGDMPISEEKKREYSNELQVTPDTPPAFVTHAVDDDVVKVQNAILFVAALQKNKVPVETFFYAKGGHGYGMDNPTSDVDWIDSCINWLLKLNL